MAKRRRTAGHGVWRPAISVDCDGGGAILVWLDERSLDVDIYAQRVTPEGRALWTGGGVPIVVAPGDQVLPRIISDDNAGIIVAWHDEQREASNVLLQRVDQDGRQLWDSAGVPVGFQRMHAMSEDTERHFDLAADGAGGALLAWNGQLLDGGAPKNAILMQRVSPDGLPLWPGQGVPVRIEPNWFGLGTPRLLPVGTADAIVVWEDNRDWYKTDAYDVYAQRVTEGSYRSYLPGLVR